MAYTNVSKVKDLQPLTPNMHAQNISLLFLVPLLMLLLGVFYMIGGMLRQLDSGYFKRAFIFYFLGTFSTFFVMQLLTSNHLDSIMTSELDFVFIYSTYGLAVFAAFGFIYFYFNNFIPMIFIRASVFLSIFALITGSIVTYKKSTNPDILNSSSNQFQEVQQAKPPIGGEYSPHGPK